MKPYLIASLPALFLIMHPFAVSAQGDLDLLLSAKTIRCSMEQGATSEFDGEKVSFKRGKFSKNPEDSLVTYAKIDLKQGTALIIGNAGTDDVIVRTAEMGLNFIAFTGSGAIVTATIFSNRDVDGNYFYVTSRHTQLSLGITTSLPSQWTGLCKVIE